MSYTPGGGGGGGGGGEPGDLEIRRVTASSVSTDTVTATTAEVVAKPIPLRGISGQSYLLNGATYDVFPAYVSGNATQTVSGMIILNVGASVTGVTGADWIEIGAARTWVRVS